ncbi:serine/threonine kinase family protein [Plesiocystis pacifica SIR-1]|uniref:Serine/threonine kinase family protein n=1 Tax=Plesiocystis pacifica SIR-1 TaxID=391625 RepID=A6GEU7_9BACT|nr:serine/threonine-protein kinase [Plesiocystis pacifica]EDM75609.1 serine/threonine kinase family protein [Plesiocystis pacifica SIR-1]
MTEAEEDKPSLQHTVDAPGVEVSAFDATEAGEDDPTRDPLSPSTLTRLEPGAPIGRYVVLGRIGVGGMGVVYAAYDAELDRRIAVKLMLSPRRGRGSQGAARLLREAQAMARLSHPNVITVHDVGTHQNGVFVAMEYIEGGTLRDWMDAAPTVPSAASMSDAAGAEARRAHPWPEVLARFLPAGRGLAAAHGAQLIHRDFKPANVLLGRASPAPAPSEEQTRRERASTLGAPGAPIRVADFGLARQADAPADPDEEPPSSDGMTTVETVDRSTPMHLLRATSQARDPSRARTDEPETLDDDSLDLDPELRMLLNRGSRAGESLGLSARLTKTGARMGTPAYMSPEQYAGDEVDARADQFAFCVALYEALYGQRPYAGDNLHALMFAIHHGELAEPPRGSDVPSSIRQAVVRGLALDPEQRWPSMDALLQELSHDPQIHRRRVALGLGLALAFVGAVALAFASGSAREQAPRCVDSARAFAGTFEAEQRAAIEARAEALGDRWTATTLRNLLPALDAWGEDWQAAWVDACAATHLRHEQSAELLDRRMLCLERRRRRFAGFVEGLARADEDHIEDASKLLDAVGDVDDCADLDALEALVPLPADPERRAAIEAIQTKLDRAEAMTYDGDFKRAESILDALEPQVEALDWRPLGMELHWVRGRVPFEDDAAREAKLRQALADAIAINDARNAARIGTTLASLLKDGGERFDEALDILALVEAFADRLGGDGIILGGVEIERSNIYAHNGEYELSLAAAEKALAIRAPIYPADNVRIGDCHFTIALAYYRLGRFDEASREFGRARAVWADKIGPDHPRTRSALTTEGALALQLNRFDEAKPLLEESLDSTLRVFGPDHVKTSSARANLAVLYSSMGLVEQAKPLLDRVLDHYTEYYGPDSVWVGHALANRAMVLSALGQHEAAFADADRALTIVREAMGEDHPELSIAWMIRASTQRAAGKLDAAEADYQASLALILRTAGADSLSLTEVYRDLARLELARAQAEAEAEGAEHLAKASAWLDKADALPKGERPDQISKAHLAFLRAQVLAADEPARARELAELALSLLRAHGDSRELGRAEVEAWLAGLD